MKHLFFVILALGLATVGFADQQFTLRSGSVQIGSAPGRVNMVRPAVRRMTLGTRVQFAFTVDAPVVTDLCGGLQRCHATVGLRSFNDTGIPFYEEWSTYLLPADLADRALTLDLPSTAPTNALPRGDCDLVVRIVRNTAVLFEHRVPVVVE